MASRRTYIVNATRSERWWSIEVPEVKGAYSQARRIDQIDEMARDVLSLLLEVPEDSFDLDIHATLDDVVTTRIRKAADLRRQAEDLTERAAVENRAIVAALRSKGLPLRDIGSLLGISHQRAGQLAGSRRGR